MISPDPNDGGLTVATPSGIHVQLTKIVGLTNPVWQGEPGLFDGYSVKGHFIAPPTVGDRFEMDRYWRNGVEIKGRTRTSPVRIVEATADGFAFTTDNSAYVLIRL